MIMLFCEQVAAMTWKNLHQKKLAGRTTLKEILTPLGMIGFWIYIMIMSSIPVSYPDAVYDIRDLPPLSTSGRWGIFRDPDEDNVIQFPDTIDSKRMYYSPNDHEGVNQLVGATLLVVTAYLLCIFFTDFAVPDLQMGNFSLKYPQVDLFGFRTTDDVSDQYARNIFKTWSAITFDLSPEQISSGLLVVDQVNPIALNYKIRVGYNEMVLPDDVIDEDVYRDTIVGADQWANSGYFTIQNFVGTYAAQLYDSVDSDFTVITDH